MRHSWSSCSARPRRSRGLRCRSPSGAGAERRIAVLFGDTVTFSLPPDGTWKCRIEEIRGTFARCGDPSGPPTVRYGDRQADQQSVNARP